MGTEEALERELLGNKSDCCSAFFKVCSTRSQETFSEGKQKSPATDLVSAVRRFKKITFDGCISWVAYYLSKKKHMQFWEADKKKYSMMVS